MLEFLKYLLNPQCKDTTFLDTSHEVFQIHPIAVSIKPWLGRHQVFGIFPIPIEHHIQYPIIISVVGAGQYRKEASMVNEKLEGYISPNGHRLLQVNLKTRVALSMRLRGLSFLLNELNNWTLTYVTKPSSSADVGLI